MSGSIDRERQIFLNASIEVLRREVPDSLDFVFQGTLPTLRWQDGSSTDPRLLRGWLAAAGQRDQLEPSAEQRSRAELLDGESRGSLALWLLRVWIAEDSRQAPELSEARRAELRSMAEKAAEVARRFGRGGTDPEQRFRQLVAQEGRVGEPASWVHRGLLSLVAACGKEVEPELRSQIDAHIRDQSTRDPSARDQNAGRPESSELLSRLARLID